MRRADRATFGLEIVIARREPKLFVGNPDPVREFTDVRDVVRAYIMLLSRPRKFPVYDVCSGRPVAVRDLLSTLRRSADRPIEIVPDPDRMRANEISMIVGDPGRLREEVGWQPAIPLRQTLDDLLSH